MTSGEKKKEQKTSSHNNLLDQTLIIPEDY